MRRTTYRRPPLSTKSPVPVFFNTRSTVGVMNNVVAKLPERVERGRLLLLLHMAGFLRDRIIALAPDVVIGGEEQDYAKDLRISLIPSGRDEDSVAIYFANERVVLNESTQARMVLYVRPLAGAPEWVSTLERYGPWPATLLPVQIPPGVARVVSRVGRADEVAALTRRIQQNARTILVALDVAGATGAEIPSGGKAVGLEVSPDVAHAVLRAEMGLDGQAPRPHWRPAFRALMSALPDAMRRFNKYVVTGQASVFNLPEVEGKGSMEQLRDGAGFVRELAPFVPKR